MYATIHTNRFSGTSMADEAAGLSISIQFRQPEIMFFTDLNKTEGHALLLRTELLIDYSCHSNIESLVVSLAGLQVRYFIIIQIKNNIYCIFFFYNIVVLYYR